MGSKKYSKKNSGFTLIELLVVISIIGFLSTFAVIALKNSREKARDAIRLSDLKQIKNALEMYYNDYRSYPPATANGKIGVGGTIDTLLRTYLAKTPRDPLGPTDSPTADGNHYYYYDANQPCTGGEYAAVSIIFASDLESASGNPAKICTTPWSGTEIAAEGTAGSYAVLVGPGQ